MLKPGRRMVFSDMMQSEEAESRDMQEVGGSEMLFGPAKDMRQVFRRLIC